jgi:hypothetical protein
VQQVPVTPLQQKLLPEQQFAPQQKVVPEGQQVPWQHTAQQVPLQHVWPVSGQQVVPAQSASEHPTVVEVVDEVVVDVVPLTQVAAVANDVAGGQPDAHAWPAAQQVRLAPLPHGVLPAGHPHRPRLASMQATPL